MPLFRAKVCTSTLYVGEFETVCPVWLSELIYLIYCYDKGKAILCNKMWKWINILKQKIPSCTSFLSPVSTKPRPSSVQLSPLQGSGGPSVPLQLFFWFEVECIPPPDAVLSFVAIWNCLTAELLNSHSANPMRETEQYLSDSYILALLPLLQQCPCLWFHKSQLIWDVGYLLICLSKGSASGGMRVLLLHVRKEIHFSSF